jgi:hypothetical protein
MTPQMEESFLRLAIPRRVGTIAVNANRLARVLAGQNTIEGARDLISESMQFIEWTAPQLEPDKKYRMAEWQQELGALRRVMRNEASEINHDQVMDHAKQIAEEFFAWMESLEVGATA